MQPPPFRSPEIDGTSKHNTFRLTEGRLRRPHETSKMNSNVELLLKQLKPDLENEGRNG